MVTPNSTAGIYEGILKVLEKPTVLEVYRNNIPEVQKIISFENGLQEFEAVLR